MTSGGYAGRPHSAPALHGVDPAWPTVDTAPLGVDLAAATARPTLSDSESAPSEEDPARSAAAGFAAEKATLTDAQRRIAQLLADAVNHMISAGLELASVRSRLPGKAEQSVLELATRHLDTALIDIRRLAVQNALGGHVPEQDSPG
jgi:phage terminase Nu1 subunit (DNA packaging protein)